MLGLHDQFGGFLGGVAVMVGKGLALRDRDAGLRDGCEKFLRIADAGEGENLARFQRRDRGRIGHQPAVENRQSARRGGNDIARGFPSPTTSSASVRASCAASGARKGPAGNTRALPMPRRPSTTAMREILGERGVLQAVVHDDDAGAGRAAACAPATRSRATMVGATRASSSASSPTCAARSVCASTRLGPARLPP